MLFTVTQRKHDYVIYSYTTETYVTYSYTMETYVIYIYTTVTYVIYSYTTETWLCDLQLHHGNICDVQLHHGNICYLQLHHGNMIMWFTVTPRKHMWRTVTPWNHMWFTVTPQTYVDELQVHCMYYIVLQTMCRWMRRPSAQKWLFCGLRISDPYSKVSQFVLSISKSCLLYGVSGYKQTILMKHPLVWCTTCTIPETISIYNMMII